MYKEHDQLETVDDNLKIWRYMNLAKFLNLITSKTLWFNRIDKFEDIYEGRYPEANEVKRKDIYECEVSKEIYDDMEKFARENLYVCCFHANEYESAAMWSLYAREEGVAICSTTERLKQCFENEKCDIEISWVNYIDYSKDFLPEGNLFYLALTKRKSFEHEKEVRCIFYDSDRSLKNINGVNITVDLDRLIEKVYISPYAPEFLKSCLESVLREYNYNIEVIQSKLYTYT